jgi:hypothetical protein
MLITTTQTDLLNILWNRDPIAIIAHNFDPVTMSSELLTNHNRLLQWYFGRIIHLFHSDHVDQHVVWTGDP